MAKEYASVVLNSRLMAEKKTAPNRRAEALADRIEEGAAGLAAFIEGISEAEWSTPISAAFVYPIEVDLARAIGAGRAITDVTWDAVAEINGKHAGDTAKVTKSEALDLLRKNSREAAKAVRLFTDEELDRAAPFSLSYGAPVTAQFVVEDHALRHSWHHLARIRKALGR